MTPATRCVMPGCYRTTHGTHCCHIHELAPTATVDAEYEAARLDPTTDRDPDRPMPPGITEVEEW